MVVSVAVLQTQGLTLAQSRANGVGDAAIAAEAQRRHDALIVNANNLTHASSLAAHAEKTTTHFELFVPQPEGEPSFSFWADTNEGQLSFRLLGPDGYAQAWPHLSPVDQFTLTHLQK